MFAMNQNKRPLITIFFLFISLLNIAYAGEDHTNIIAEGKKLVDEKVSCESLNDEQLEAIGEYYMGQMHPGSAHDAMDAVMGGEGSESLKQMHINIAKQMYCSERTQFGMVNMVQGGMMQMMGNMMGGGMMGPLWTNNYGYSAWSPFYSIFSWVLFGLIIYFGYKAFQEHGKDNRWVWLLIGSIVLLILFGSSGMGGFGMMGVGLGFGMIMMVLFWGAIIWLVFNLFKPIAAGSEEPLEILRKRYAKGEITKKQFEQMKKRL